MPIPTEQPEDHPLIRFRVTLPAVFTFVITMIVVYMLGMAPKPYYQSSEQSIRVDVIALQDTDGVERAERVQE